MLNIADAAVRIADWTRVRMLATDGLRICVTTDYGTNAFEFNSNEEAEALLHKVLPITEEIGKIGGSRG